MELGLTQSLFQLTFALANILIELTQQIFTNLS